MAISYQSHPNGYLRCDVLSPWSPAKSQELTCYRSPAKRQEFKTSRVKHLWSGFKGDSDVPDVHGTQILKAPLDISNTKTIYKPRHSTGHKTYETRTKVQRSNGHGLTFWGCLVHNRRSTSTQFEALRHVSKNYKFTR